MRESDPHRARRRPGRVKLGVLKSCRMFVCLYVLFLFFAFGALHSPKSFLLGCALRWATSGPNNLMNGRTLTDSACDVD